MDTVSVVIPTYNRASFLKHSIGSVLEQTHAIQEIIVVDDGSTDNSKDIVESLARHKPIKYIYQENKGISSARNAGIVASSGDYIAFLDSDDAWLPTKIEKQLETFKNNSSLGLVHCKIDFIDATGNRSTPPSTGWLPDASGKCLEKLLQSCLIHTSAAMVPRSVIHSVGMFDETLRTNEDYEFFLRIAHTHEIACVNEVLSVYRTHEGGITGDRTALDIERIHSLEVFRKKIDADHSVRKLINASKSSVYCRLAKRMSRSRGNRHRAYAFILRALFLAPFSANTYHTLVEVSIPETWKRHLLWYKHKLLSFFHSFRKGQPKN